MDCIDIATCISAIGDGIVPDDACASVAAHVSQCDECQLLVALRVMAWEEDHELPQPPTIIARWRATALHLAVGKDRAGLAQLKAAVREGWSLDEIQERALRGWLEALVKQARGAGGFGPGFGG